MPAPDDEYLFSLLMQIVQRASEHLLGARDEVAPYSVRLIGDDASPRTFFPQDLNPTAEWPDLLDAAIDALRLDEPDGEVVAVAACVGLVSPDTNRLAFGAQLETQASSAFMLVTYREEGDSFSLDDPVLVEDLLRAEGLRWDTNSRRRLARQ